MCAAVAKITDICLVYYEHRFSPVKPMPKVSRMEIAVAGGRFVAISQASRPEFAASGGLR